MFLDHRASREPSEVDRREPRRYRWPMPASPQLDSPRVRDLVTRLSDPHLTTEEAVPLLAAFDGHEGEAALPLFGLLHDTVEPAVLHTVSRILSRWSALPVARALVPALEALLGESSVQPLNKMAAAGLLELFGSPVDYAGLAGGLDAESVGRVGQEALETLLRSGNRPLALSNALERIGEMPEDLVMDLIDDLRRLDDARAEPLLAALSHAADPDVAVAAVAALDALGRPEAQDALLRVSAHHHDSTVRAQARQTLARIGERERTGVAAGRPKPSPSPAARLTNHGRVGDDQALRLLLMAVADPRHPGLHDVYVAVLDPERGLRSYATAEGLSEAALEGLRERMAYGAEPLTPISPAQAQWALQEAANHALAQEATGVAVVHVPWLRYLARSLLNGSP